MATDYLLLLEKKQKAFRKTKKTIEKKLQLDAEIASYERLKKKSIEELKLDEWLYVLTIEIVDFICEKAKTIRDGFIHLAQNPAEIIDILKKLLDILDDAWAATRSALKKIIGKIFDSISPLIISITGTLIHTFEAYEELKTAKQAILDIEEQERLENELIDARKKERAAFQKLVDHQISEDEYNKINEEYLIAKKAYAAIQTPEKINAPARLIFSSLNSLLAIGGAVLSLELLSGTVASAFFHVVIPATFTLVASPIISGLLTIICLNRLQKNSFILHDALKEEEKAKFEYEECLKNSDYGKFLQEQKESLEMLTTLNDFYSDLQKIKMQTRNDVPEQILEKIKKELPLTLQESKSYQSYIATANEKVAERIYQVKNQNTQLSNYFRAKNISDETSLLNNIKQLDDICSSQKEPENVREKREAYYACRQNRLKAEREVAFNTCELLASAIVLSGVITGCIPLIGIGVVIGLSIKIFEKIDSKLDHRPTEKLRKKFTQLFTPDPPQVTIQLVKQPVAQSAIAKNASIHSADNSVPIKIPVTKQGMKSTRYSPILFAPVKTPIIPLTSSVKKVFASSQC